VNLWLLDGRQEELAVLIQGGYVVPALTDFKHRAESGSSRSLKDSLQDIQRFAVPVIIGAPVNPSESARIRLAGILEPHQYCALPISLW